MITFYNLVPRSLLDKAEGEIWSNPICARVRDYTFYSQVAFAFNKSISSETLTERPFYLIYSEFLRQKSRVVQYSDKFMHGIVLYSLHITILYKSITIRNEAKQ